MNTETVTILHDNQLVERMSLSKSHVNSDDFYLTLFETNLFLWQHFHISSFFLFSRTFESGGAITIFSVKQKSHFFVPHLYRDTYDFMLYFRWQSSRKVLGLFRISISSRPKNSNEQKIWINIKISSYEQVCFEQCEKEWT